MRCILNIEGDKPGRTVTVAAEQGRVTLEVGGVISGMEWTWLTAEEARTIAGWLGAAAAEASQESAEQHMEAPSLPTE